MTIEISSPQDIESIFRLYRNASDYQRSKFEDNIWPDFDPEMIKIEIAEQRQFKLVINNQIACVWAVTFNDLEIWGERDTAPSIYLHRIATDPGFRGKNLVARIVEWAKPYAMARGKKFIRLDTCGNNTKLIAHYTKAGFIFLGMQRLQKLATLPSHYHDADVCYFEIALE